MRYDASTSCGHSLKTRFRGVDFEFYFGNDWNEEDDHDPKFCLIVDGEVREKYTTQEIDKYVEGDGFTDWNDCFIAGLALFIDENLVGELFDLYGN